MRTPFDPPDSTPDSGAAKGDGHRVYDQLELQQFPEGPFRDLYQYWSGLRVGDQPPLARDFDMLALPHLVPDFVVADYQEGRIRFRYSGEGFNVETGRDLTGLYMDDMSSFDDIRERAEECEKTGVPYVVTDHPVTWASHAFKSYSTLAVPLADTNGKIVQIVYVLVYS